jgi:hypothetical protein
MYFSGTGKMREGSVGILRQKITRNSFAERALITKLQVYLDS